MPSAPQKRSLGPEQRRALELLAGDRHGVNAELLLYGHGLTRQTLAGLVRAGLVATRREVMAGAKAVAVMRLRITAAGRSAIGSE